MSSKRSNRSSSDPSGFGHRGRPRVHNREAHVALLRWVEEQQKRTGLSVSKILKFGRFVQLCSGAPESCGGGPHQPEVLHVLEGATLRRRYFEAKAWLKRNIAAADQGRTEPEWMIPWVKLY